MANKFRQTAPIRTCKKTYANYESFKPYLAKDFNRRCGYTDCSDFWFGGSNNFHIDHFIPWKNYPKRPNLKTDYSNLVYSCSYVNILKSNDEGDYIDPCDNDFNDHFDRYDDGSIVPKAASIEANYMYKKLKLGMQRYRIIWLLDTILEKWAILNEAIKTESDDVLKENLKITQGELGNLIAEYLIYLKQEQ